MALAPATMSRVVGVNSGVGTETSECDRLPELLGKGRLEACPRRPERFVVGEPHESEHEPRRERLRPLNIGVAKQQVDPLARSLARSHVPRKA